MHPRFLVTFKSGTVIQKNYVLFMSHRIESRSGLAHIPGLPVAAAPNRTRRALFLVPRVRLLRNTYPFLICVKSYRLIEIARLNFLIIFKFITFKLSSNYPQFVSAVTCGFLLRRTVFCSPSVAAGVSFYIQSR